MEFGKIEIKTYFLNITKNKIKDTNTCYHESLSMVYK